MRAQIMRAPSPLPEPEARWCRELALEALTPIYKGGANRAEAERGYPFRGPTLRGQLRTWWRATQSTDDHAALRIQEEALFGGVFERDAEGRSQPTASKVRVGLSGLDSKLGAPGGGFDYAISWLNYDANAFHLGARATLRIEAPTEAGDAIDAALRAWLLLGGVGSRSRRGLGKVWTPTPAVFTQPTSIEDVLALLRPLIPDLRDRGWPSLAGVRLAFGPQTTGTANAAVAAGLTAFKALRGMRALGAGHFSGEDRAPEFQHEWAALRNSNRNLPGFTPALGMPLTYRSANHHLPRPVTLAPPGRGARLPSPVLVGVVPLGPGRFLPMITLLRPWSSTRFSGRRGESDVSGTVNPGAIDVVARELVKAGWSVHPGGAA